MKTPQENIKTINELESRIYDTGIVSDIDYKAPYIIVFFSQKLDGLQGIRMACNNKKALALQNILDRIVELQSKTSMFKAV